MDLATLEQRVRTTTEALEPSIDALVPEFIRDAQIEAEDRHVFLAMETSLAATSVTGTRKLADRPADWIKRLDVPTWLHGQAGDNISFEWAASVGQLAQLYTSSTETRYYGAPKHLLETATELHLYPLPDALNPVGVPWALGTYPITVPYVARLATLTDPADTNWLSENGAPYLIARAAGEAMFQNRDYDGATLWLGRARMHLSRLIRLDKRQRFHRNQHFTPIPQSARRVGRERSWL